MAWTDSLDNDTRAYAANKGWDRLEGDAGMQAVVQSYRNLERARPQIEAPPKEYTFEGIQAKPEILERARGIAIELKLPATAAATLAQRLVAEDTAATTAAETAAAKAIADSVARLDTAWGADKEARTGIAGRAFEALSLSKETVDALVTTLGVDKVMTMGYDLGTKMGEATLLKGSTSVDNKPEVILDRTTAIAERAKMFNDKDWFDKWQAGDAAAVERFNKVTTAILGTPEKWEPAPENFGRQGHQGTEIQPGSQYWKGPAV